MGKIYKSFIFVLIFVISLSLLTVLNKNNISAEDQKLDKPMQNDYYTIIDEAGNVTFIKYDEKDNELKTLESNDYEVIKKSGTKEEVIETYDTYEEAQKAIEKAKSTTPKMKSKMRTAEPQTPVTYDIEAIADTRKISFGVARIKGFVEYREVESNGQQGRKGYTHGSSANDAAYISTSSDGKTIRVKQAGVVMDIPVASVSVSEYNTNSKVSYYQGKNGKFYHYYCNGDSDLATTQVGYTPSYLQDGIKYYSYDGHYFYKDYVQMLKDYMSGYDYYANAVNVNKPYYNYYQYLSFRSTTSFVASDFNKLVIDTKGKNTNSKLKDQGQSFINSQNKRGTNASLMFGVAVNESAWGTSKYAQERNNLFGLGAVDSDPDKAYRFDTIEDCLVYFSYNSISSGYLNGSDYRYRGPHLGDKRSGVNVKYASDPYWGEKAASFSYRLNANTGNKDYQKYQLIISKMLPGQNLYADVATTKKIYDSSVSDKYENLYCYPMTVLSQDGNSYKVLSDTVLDASRTKKNASGYFDVTRDYVYVPISHTNKVGEASNLYLRGDVNGDNQVLADDYMQVKLHVLNRKKLTGNALVRADVNGDDKIDASDYMLIKLHVLGRKKLF